MEKISLAMKAIGDISVRKELGSLTRVEIFRIVRAHLVDTVNIALGEKAANSIVHESGKIAGYEIYQNFLRGAKDLNELVTKTTELLKTLKVGLLRVDKADVKKGEFLITVNECVSCAGVPDRGEPICYFEGGIIAGVLENFTGKDVEVKEIKCWAMGNQTCQFEVKIK